MIYKDDEGVTTIEYGHGSVQGFATEVVDGTCTYVLCSTDKGEIGRGCPIFPEVVGKPDTSVFPSVRFIFHKKDSLLILMQALEEIYNRMSSNQDIKEKTNG